MLVSIAATSDNRLVVADSKAVENHRPEDIYTFMDDTSSPISAALPVEAITVPQGIAVQEVERALPVIWVTDYETPTLFWSDPEHKQNGKIDLGGKAVESHSRGLAYGKVGENDLVVIAQEGIRQGHVFVVDAKSKAVLESRTQDAPSGSCPTNIILHPAVSRAFVGDYKNSRIYYFDPTKDAGTSNPLRGVDLQTPAKKGVVYGMALNTVSNCLWALDSHDAKLYCVRDIDSTPKVDSHYIDLGALKLSGFWDLTIDSEGYLWMPCLNSEGKSAILQLNAEGNVVNVTEVVDEKNVAASYLDTLTVAPSTTGQAHDLIYVVNRQSPASVYEISPGSIAKHHSPGPNPDPRVLSQNLKFTVTPTPPLKTNPNQFFPAFKVTVTDKDTNGVVTNCPVELRISDKNSQNHMNIVKEQAGGYATSTYATFVTDASTGIASIPAGVLKAGTAPDKTLKFELTTRGATPQEVPCEIMEPFTLDITPDKEEWARRNTGTFMLQVRTSDNQAGHSVTFTLKDEDFNDGARFLDPNTNSALVEKTHMALTDAKGNIALKLKAGKSLRTYIIMAQAPAARNPDPINLQRKHVKPVPSQLTVKVEAGHQYMFAPAKVMVEGLDDASKLVPVPFESLHFTLANLKAENDDNIIDVTSKRDINQRNSFFKTNSKSEDVTNNSDKFWTGPGYDPHNPGLACTLVSDEHGLVVFTDYPTDNVPAIRTMPEGDYVKLTVNPVEPVAKLEGSDFAEIRH